jgi:hypothetical protein
MHQHAGRLVDDGEVGVGVEDGEHGGYLGRPVTIFSLSSILPK